MSQRNVTHSRSPPPPPPTPQRTMLIERIIFFKKALIYTSNLVRGFRNLYFTFNLGGVYTIPDRVSFRYDFIPVPYQVSVFVYMILTKIVFRNESFQNNFIPVVASDRNFRSRTKSVCTFHLCHVKEVRVHSGTEISKWIGWADQLTHVFDLSMLLQHFHSRMRTSM